MLVDSTHSTNKATYKLITLMVLDQHGEGVPIAFCISKHDSSPTLIVFYSAIKMRCGEIHPSCIMSDDAPQFYTSFLAVFSTRPTKLLCIWHVWRAWNRHANSIQEKVIRESVKRNLRNTQARSDIAVFDVNFLYTICFKTFINKSVSKYFQ